MICFAFASKREDVKGVWVCHSEAAKTARNPLHPARVAQVGWGSLAVFAARDDTFVPEGAATSAAGRAGYAVSIISAGMSKFDQTFCTSSWSSRISRRRMICFAFASSTET
jgi:hypothetical protein